MERKVQVIFKYIFAFDLFPLMLALSRGVSINCCEEALSLSSVCFPPKMSDK